MSNLFKGYAQKTELSGNLLKGADPSDKILEEGKRYLNQWKDVSQGEQQNQINYLNALEAKFQAEEADRARNRKLESYFADGFEKALTKRHEGLIRNAEAKVKESQKQSQQLKEWSGTAANIGVEAAKGFAKARQDYGRNLAIDLGLSWNTAKGIQSVTDILDDTYKGTNSAVLEARKKGASWDQINQIRKLSFLGNQGFRVGAAMNIGENYISGGILKNQSEKFDFKGRSMSLHDATQESNVEASAAILRKIRDKYLEEAIEKSGVSNKLLSKYARESIIRAEGRVISTVREKNIKAEQEKVESEERELTRVRIKERTYWKHFQTQIGPNGENRAGALAAGHNQMTELFSLGLLNEADYNYIEEIPIDVNGKTQLYGDKFTKRMLDLKQAMVKHQTQTIERLSISSKVEKAKLLENTALFKQELDNADTPLSKSRLATLIAESDKRYGPNNVMSKMLANRVRDHVSEANNIIYEPHLQNLQRQGLVTSSIVKSYMLTPEAEAKWLKVAKQQDPTQPSKEEEDLLDKYVDTQIEEILSQFGVDGEDVASSKLAAYVGKQKIKQYFTTYAKDPNISRNDLILRASERFQIDIEKDYQVTEFSNNIRKPHFAKFSVGAKMHSVPLSEMTSEQFAANPKLPYEKVLLEPVKVVEFFDNVAQGRNVGFPADASHYVSKFGIGPNGEVKMTELMFLEAQMKLINPDFKIPPMLLQAHKVAFNQIRPEYRKYIVGAQSNVNSAAVGLKYSGLEHESGKTENNFAERNTTDYFNMFRAPINMHPYMNLDPNGEADKLDWTELLMMGAN
tara:strand:+ start:82 stop:2484 length:2403 start_codon:yes stop_codon:yes gene_type:complete